MSWFNVDDKIADSPGVMRLNRRYRAAAIGVWSLCGGWLSSHLNAELFVPDEVITQYCGTPTLVGELVRAGFWERVAGGVVYTAQGCRVATAESAQAQRSATAQRVAKHRANKQKGVDQQEDPHVTVLHSNGVTGYPGVVTKEPLHTTPSLGAVEHAAYASNAAARDDPPPDDVWELATAERTDLSTPVNVGATRLVATVLPRNFGNGAIRTGLRIEASALLNSGAAEDDVAECIRTWLQKPDLGVKALKACMSEVYKKRLPTGAKTSGVDGYRAALERSALDTIEGETP